MSFTKTLSRDEMKNVTAGNKVYVRCDGCQNSTCRGFVDADCTTAAYRMCGPGRAGSSGPAKSTCVAVR